jgi:hypothetical protein
MTISYEDKNTIREIFLKEANGSFIPINHAIKVAMKVMEVSWTKGFEFGKKDSKQN